MRRPKNWRIVQLLAPALLCGATAMAQVSDEVQHLTGRHADAQFMAGEDLLIDAAVEDDIFAAGDRVRFQGARADHVIAAADTLVLTAVSARDLVLAGREISLDGNVADDVVAAGWRVGFTENARVGDGVQIAADTLAIAGRIDGTLSASARRISIRGGIGGDARLTADEIVLEPGAHIGGSLRYRSPAPAQIAPDAVVEGGIRHMQENTTWHLGEVSIWASAGIWLAGLVSAAVLAAGSQVLFPRLLSGATGRAATRPWASLGVGLALLVGTPMAAALLIATIFGALLGLVLLALYAAALALGAIAAAAALGRLLAQRLRGSRPSPRFSGRFLWTLLGLVILSLLSVIPAVGGLLLFLALMLGLGALGLQLWELRRAAAAS